MMDEEINMGMEIDVNECATGSCTRLCLLFHSRPR